MGVFNNLKIYLYCFNDSWVSYFIHSAHLFKFIETKLLYSFIATTTEIFSVIEIFKLGLKIYKRYSKLNFLDLKLLFIEYKQVTEH